MRAFPFAALTIAALALAAAAAAQDGSEAGKERTVEGAQAFLKTFYEDHSSAGEFVIWVNGSQWLPYQEAKPAGHHFAFLSGDVARAEAQDRCTTTFHLERIRTKRFFANTPSVTLQMPAGGVSRRVDWSRVTRVRVRDDDRYDDDGSTVKTGATLVAVGSKGDEFDLVFGAKEDAERVAFAMDFLRENCSVKSDTGF